jgi:hypothetical protein
VRSRSKGTRSANSPTWSPRSLRAVTRAEWLAPVPANRASTRSRSTTHSWVTAVFLARSTSARSIAPRTLTLANRRAAAALADSSLLQDGYARR